MADFRIDEAQLEKIFEEWDCHSPFLVPKQQIRVEALRAASRIVAGPAWSKLGTVDGPKEFEEDILTLTKAIAKYLEAGE